jgi:hypothetical protein
MSEPTQIQPAASQSSWLAKNATELSDPNWNFGELFSGKNTIIIILLVLVILSLIGINLLNITGNLVDGLVHIFGPTIKNLFAMLGYSTGELINDSADVAASAAVLGVDIAKGTTHSIGDLLINSSKGGMNESDKRRLDDALNSPRCDKDKEQDNEPVPVQSSEPTVAAIGSQKPKAGWCYVGDYAGSRGCVSMTEHNKCMSGQVFQTQAACLSPDKSR